MGNLKFVIKVKEYNKKNNREEEKDKPNFKLLNRDDEGKKLRKNYFIDKDKKRLREELMTSEGESIAKLFEKNGLTKSQLRAFYNEVKALKNKLDSNENNFESIYISILMLLSKVEYRAKDSSLNGLKEFIKMGVYYIKEEYNEDVKAGIKAFKNFALFFEVVVGYTYGRLKNN